MGPCPALARPNVAQILGADTHEQSSCCLTVPLPFRLGRNSLAQAMPQTPGGTAISVRHAYAVAASLASFHSLRVGNAGGRLVWNVSTLAAMAREKSQAPPTGRPKVPMRRRGAHCLVVVRHRLCRPTADETLISHCRA